jgi:hypothetical protein
VVASRGLAGADVREYHIKNVPKLEQHTATKRT